MWKCKNPAAVVGGINKPLGELTQKEIANLSEVYRLKYFKYSKPKKNAEDN